MNVDDDKRDVLLALAAAAISITWMSLEGIARRSSSEEVDVAQAKALIDGGALVIDVRSQEAFERAHLPTAVLLPLAQLNAGVPAGLAGAQNKHIVVYCDDGLTSGPAARAVLARHGFKKVANLKGGIEGWMRASARVR